LSTPVTNSSLASDCAEVNHTGLMTTEDVIFPNYDDGGYFGRLRLDSLEPPPSPQPGNSDTTSPHEQHEWAAASRPGSPNILERAEDDISVRAQPSRHVDYFSHDWREEDIWSSWKFIVSRRGDYTNSARLENASWRTWMKARNNLSTVSAETLNWYAQLFRLHYSTCIFSNTAQAEGPRCDMALRAVTNWYIKCE
jgi:hypothetical protein